MCLVIGYYGVDHRDGVVSKPFGQNKAFVKQISYLNYNLSFSILKCYFLRKDMLSFRLKYLTCIKMSREYNGKRERRKERRKEGRKEGRKRWRKP